MFADRFTPLGRRTLLRAALPWGLALALAACAHGPATPTTETAADVQAEPLSEADFAGALRAYFRLPLDDEQRPGLRAQLLATLAVRGDALVEAEDYDAAIEHLKLVTSLYTPQELAQQPPASIEPVLHLLEKRGERAGDEARVLSSLWMQMHLHPEDPAPADYYRELRTWSEEARADYGMLTEALDGLIEVLEEHARLTPGPKVLDDLADRYIERRRQLVQLLGPRPQDPDRMSFEVYREAASNLAQAPLDVAGLYLVNGDVEGALARLRTMETITGKEPMMRKWLADIVDGGAQGSETTLLLAYAFAEVGRGDVSKSLCRMGLRSDGENGRFLRCLGWLAAQEDDFVEATYDYAEAVRLSPDDRALYDEALQVLANMLRDGLFDSDPEQTRALAGQAEAILKARMERWPEAAPPVALEDIELAVGMAEMGAGNTQAARKRFESSLAIKETVRALVQLGQLEARLGELTEAAIHLRRALDLTPTRSLDQASQRAQVLEHLADVMRATTETTQAQKLYEEALTLWDAALGSTKNRIQRSAMQTRRGVLLERLGRQKEAVAAFELAMAAAPDDRETYAQILSHMVVGDPAPDFAESVLRRAQRQLTLAPEWKTYFALWVKAISARAGEKLAPEVERLLERLSRSDAWWGQLAKFGRGDISYETLREAATNRGEQTEADFYEGTRLLAHGEGEAARGLFQKVLETQMVSFYEYQMALELLRD